MPNPWENEGRQKHLAHICSMPWKIDMNPIPAVEQDNARTTGMYDVGIK